MGLVGLELVANSLLYAFPFFYSRFCFLHSTHFLFSFFFHSLILFFNHMFFTLFFVSLRGSHHISLWCYLIPPSFLDVNVY